MMKLDEVPEGINIVWWGKKGWDNGCREDNRVEAPSGEMCHGCYVALGERSEGVAARDTEGRWLYYGPDCWGEVIEEREAGAVVTKGLDAEYLEKPSPESW